MLAIGLKLCARTVASTLCPSSTGVLGVRLTRILGALASASATTRRVKLCVALLRPSLTWASTMKSTDLAGAGGPVQAAGLSVVIRAFREVAEADDERLCLRSAVGGQRRGWHRGLL